MTDGNTTNDDERTDQAESSDAGIDHDPDGDGDAEPSPDGGATGASTDPDSGARRPTEGESYDGSGSGSRSKLLWTALIVLSLLAIVALFQFYVNTSAAINRWVDPEYRRIMQALFNLVVLLTSGIGIALVVRKLGE